MKKTLLKSLALAVVGSLCLVGSSLALPTTQLDGGIGMSGAFKPINALGFAVDADESIVTIPESTGIDFLGKTSSSSDNLFFINTATGDYSSLEGKDGVFIDKFQFAALIPDGGINLWSAGEFSFYMTSVKIEKGESDGNYDLHVNGLGIMRNPNYLDTPGKFNFTGQGVDAANFTYSVSTGSEPVPEPATMLLFGTGLIGLAGVGRKLRK